MIAIHLEGHEDDIRRLMFYIDLYIKDPKSKAAPWHNARGILVNVLGKTEEEAVNLIDSLCEAKNPQ